MKEKEFDKKSFFWEADVETYNELQKLIKFVSFVSNLKECSEEDKRKASKIIDVIKYFNHAELISHFDIWFFIKDNSISRDSNKNPDIYLRNWVISLDCGSLEISAGSFDFHRNYSPVDEHFYYSSCINFAKDWEGINDNKRVRISVDINEFVNDALNYKSYLTNTLKDIEVDIDVWG